MNEFNKNCFVCRKVIPTENLIFNAEVNLFVCENCKGTQEEKKAVAEFFGSLADGLVCG